MHNTFSFLKSLYFFKNKIASHLRVVDEKHGEEEGHEAAVDQVEDAVAGGGKDDGDDAEDEEDPDGGEEVHAPAGDVELGLEGEEGEAETEGCRDSHSHHHPPTDYHR